MACSACLLCVCTHVYTHVYAHVYPHVCTQVAICDAERRHKEYTGEYKVTVACVFMLVHAVGTPARWAFTPRMAAWQTSM